MSRVPRIAKNYPRRKDAAAGQSLRQLDKGLWQSFVDIDLDDAESNNNSRSPRSDDDASQVSELRFFCH